MLTLTDERWGRLVEREARAGGEFLYAVRTTGVFCRVGCASRTPRRENVELFRTAAEARRRGYRPCRRCRPEAAGGDLPHAAAIVAACRRLEAPDPPSLAVLAGQAGLSADRFRRVFRALVGVSPREYAAGRRADRFREALERGRGVTEAIYEAGYSSSGRAYEAAAPRLGMTPSERRRRGRGLRIRYRVAPCALGFALAAATERGVCAVELGDSAEAVAAALRERFPAAEIAEADRAAGDLLERTLAKVDNPASQADLPLDVQGTAFQQRVWEALRGVPSGETVTYAELAARAGSPGAARAVGGACAANPVAVVTPCHRVTPAGGGLGGYRWGPDRKRALLDRENREKGSGRE